MKLPLMLFCAKLLLWLPTHRGETIPMDMKNDTAVFCRKNYQPYSAFDEVIQLQLEFDGLPNDCARFAASVIWSSPDFPNATCNLSINYDAAKNAGSYSIDNDHATDLTKNKTKPLSWRLIGDDQEHTLVIHNGDRKTRKLTEWTNVTCWKGQVQGERLCYNVGYKTDSENCGMRLTVNLERFPPTTPATTTTTTTTEALYEKLWFWDVVIGAPVFLLLLIIIAVLLWCCVRKRRQEKAVGTEGNGEGLTPEAVVVDRSTTKAAPALDKTQRSPAKSSKQGSVYMGVPEPLQRSERATAKTPKQSKRAVKK